MPEILEIEMYRRGAAVLIGRTISAVDSPDSWYLKGIDSTSLAQVLIRARIEGVGRVGKVLLLETSAGVCGMRFGMTGRLVVDGRPIIDRLEYSAARLDPAWNRFGLEFDGGHSMRMNDPRRLGGVTIDPDLGLLGPDAWTISTEAVVDLAGDRRTAIKALLLDQSKIAGLGNLLVDELLWRVGIAPATPANKLGRPLAASLATMLPVMLDELFDRGGSHRGNLFVERHSEGRCPDDGTTLIHEIVAGRSTWWCPTHQRR